MAKMAQNGWKLLEITINAWALLEMARMNGYDQIHLEMAKNG